MNRPSLRFLLAAAVFPLLAACVTTNVAMLSPAGRYAPVPQDQVQVFLSAEEIRGEYERIAIINAQGGSSMTNEGQMIRKLQLRAGNLGANGIILGDINEPSSGAKVAGAIFGVDPQRKGRVIAIRLKDQPAPSADQPSTQP
jgi:hypothetical protein